LKGRNLNYLIGIAVLVVLAIWIDWPSNPGLHFNIGSAQINKPIEVRQGLDLQGGLQVLLEADTPANEALPTGAMDTARTIVENRVNALGVTEPVVQRQGDRRIIVELPGIKNPEEAIATLRQTGLLEFIDAGSQNIPEGTIVQTTFAQGGSISGTQTLTTTGLITGTQPVTPTASVTETLSVSGTTPLTPTAAITTAGPVTATAPVTAAESVASSTPVTPTGPVYQTVMTGRDLDTADVGIDQLGNPEIRFKLKPSGAKIFADYTAANIGKVLSIVLDKKVISSPTIQSAIPDGSGVITGRFTLDQARAVAVQLRYGALPVPLKVDTIRTVGATLGQDSIARSITAGTIAIIVILLFMIIYYRVPGVLAALALIVYGLVNFAVYKWGIPTLQAPFFAPITLTLPGITGFIMSTGMAVDANVLIFERMKEELRSGRSMLASVDAGFDRAWTSIRDSNLSVLLNCVVLYWFANTFGASTVKGFAITLFLGVVISMFTAIVVTRTLLRAVFDVAGEKLHDNHWLMGAD
jgi:preprotein translocase subunit SecD